MSDMSWEHASEARAALNAIVTDPEHGVAALSNAQTMSNLLKDYLPDAPREKSILVAAAEAGLAATLRDHVSQGMDANTAIRLTASQFSSSTPFTPEACNWVTDEIAVALGISQGRTPGAQPGGSPFGGSPPGFAPIPGEGQATQMAPGSPSGYSPPPANQGFQSPGQGFGSAPGQPNPQDQPTAQGYRPGYQPGQQAPGQPAPGQPTQAGGFGQAAAPAFPGAPTPGFGQQGGFQAPGQAFPGQQGFGQGGPTTPGPGYPGQQPAFPGQPGFPQQGQPGAPGGWAPGGYGPSPYSGGPSKPSGSRRGLIVVGVIVLVVVIVGVALALSGGKKKPIANPTTTPSPIVTHKSSPPPTPTPTSSLSLAPGVDPIAVIMRPSGLSPVGTDCVSAKLFGLNAATLVTKTFCSHTTKPNIVVWGYQFDSTAHYQTGVKEIDHYVGFDKVTPGTSCPPSGSSTEGKTGWHANHNPKYKSKSGQDIECLIDAKKPVLIWTMPTQDAFFIGEDQSTGTSIQQLLKWWETLNYGK